MATVTKGMAVSRLSGALMEPRFSPEALQERALAEWQRQFDLWADQLRSRLGALSESADLTSVNTRLSALEANVADLRSGDTLNIYEGNGIVIDGGNTISAIRSSPYTVNAVVYARSATALGLTSVNTDPASKFLKQFSGGPPDWAQIDVTGDVIGILPLANGGTSASLTAIDGGLVYSTSTSMAITAALTGILQGNGAAAPTAITGVGGYFPFWQSSAPYLAPAGPIFTPDAVKVGVGTLIPDTALHATTVDSAASAVTDIFRIEHSDVAGLGVGGGTGLVFSGASSTTQNREMGRIQTRWTTATDATRASSMDFQTVTGGGAPATGMSLSGVGGLSVGDASTMPVGVINALTGFRVANAAVAGTVLRSNGTNYIGGQVVLTTDVTGILPVANGGTNSSSWTAGSVIFAGAGGTSLAQDNANLFWDDALNRLGVGTNAPATAIHALSAGNVEIRVEGTSAGGQAQFQARSGGFTWAIAHQSNLYGGALAFGQGGASPVFVIDRGGNVGIKITAPLARLHVPWISGDTATTAQFGTAHSSNNQTAIQANSFSSTAVVAVSSSSFGVWAISNSQAAGLMHRSDSTGVGNVVYDALHLRTVTTGAVAANFGTGLKFITETDANDNRDCARIQAIWTDATDATRTSALQFQTVNSAAALATKMRLSGDGRLGLGTSITLTVNAPWAYLNASEAFAGNVIVTNGTGANINTVAGGFLSADLRPSGTFGWSNFRGINLTVNNTATDSGSTYRGIYGSARNQSAASRANTLIGGSFDARSDSTGGTVVNAVALEGAIANNQAGATFTSAYGLQVINLINTGTITNTYGVWVGDITTGTQTNTPYSFYASDANAWNYFAGRVGIGTITSPTSILHVVESVSVAAADAIGVLFTETFTGAAIFGQASSGMQVNLTTQTSADPGARRTTGANITNTYSASGTGGMPTGSIIGSRISATNDHASATVGTTLSAYLLHGSSRAGGTTTNSYGLQTQAFATGTIGTAYGVQILDKTGSGAITTQYGIYVSSLVGATTNWAVYVAGTTQSYFGGLVGIGTGGTAPAVLLDLGLAGTTAGVMRMAGSTSGNVTIQPAAIAGTWTLTLPTSDGAANEFLQTDGAGVTSWSSVDLTTDVTGVLPVANGGTNKNSWTAGSVAFAGAGGTALAETAASFVWDYTLLRLGIGNNAPGVLLDLGLAGTTAGVIRLAGLTSGNVTIKAQSVAGTWTLELPTTDGDPGDILTTNGSGVTSWSPPAAGSAHNLLSATHSDTTAASVARGDLVVGIGATPKWERLAIGAANRLLRSDGTDVAWAQAVLTTDVTGVLPLANGGTSKDITASAGAVVYSDADSFELTGVGTAGQVLLSNGTSAPFWSDGSPLLNVWFEGSGASWSPTAASTWQTIAFGGGNFEISVTAGTWLITVIVDFDDPQTFQKMLRLYNTTDASAYSGSEQGYPFAVSDGGHAQIVLHYRITVGGTKTISVQGWREDSTYDEWDVFSTTSNMSAIRLTA